MSCSLKKRQLYVRKERETLYIDWRVDSNSVDGAQTLGPGCLPYTELQDRHTETVMNNVNMYRHYSPRVCDCLKKISGMNGTQKSNMCFTVIACFAISRWSPDSTRNREKRLHKPFNCSLVCCEMPSRRTASMILLSFRGPKINPTYFTGEYFCVTAKRKERRKAGEKTRKETRKEGEHLD